MAIKLTRPLVFFILKQQALIPQPIELLNCRTLNCFLNNDTVEKTYLLNQTVPIPAAASAIHGIYDKDVANQPTLAQIGKEIANSLKDCDFAGYNSNEFDIPFACRRVLSTRHRVRLVKRKTIDVQVIFYKKEPRTLEADLSSIVIKHSKMLIFHLPIPEQRWKFLKLSLNVMAI